MVNAKEWKKTLRCISESSLSRFIVNLCVRAIQYLGLQVGVNVQKGHLR